MKHLLFPLLFIAIISSCNSQKAKTYISSNKNDEALLVLLNLTDKSYEANYLSACALKNLKQYDNAEKRFKEVYLIKPSYRYTCLYFTQCMLKKIDLSKPATKDHIIIQNEAIKILTEGISYNKDSIPKVMLARYYATRGQLAQLQGNFTKAIEDLTFAIDLDSQGDYYSRRAMSYHFNGQDELACKDFEKGKELGEKYEENEIKKICR